MKWPLIVLGGLMLVLLMIGGCGVSMYNGLVNASVAADAQWSQVENVYQRRADLVPNMVNTVKGYMGHEHGTLKDVVEARARVGQITLKADQLTPEALEKFQKAQEGLSGALQRLLVVSEQYPNLKADSAFQDLRATLEGSENRIAVERRQFNEVVKDYNGRVERFPSNFLARMFDFKEKAYFKADAGAAKVPKVDFPEGDKK